MHDVSMAFGMAMIPDLPSVICPHKQLERTAQRLDTAAETPRFPRQSCQIMPQVCVATLNGVRLALVLETSIHSVSVDQFPICRVAVTEILLCLGSLIHERLHLAHRSSCDDGPSDNTMGGTIDRRYDIDDVFFVPTKV